MTVLSTEVLVSIFASLELKCLRSYKKAPKVLVN